jgi:hypothetical protein
MIDYFDQYKTKILPGSIIVFDDVVILNRWRVGDMCERLWCFRSIRVGGGSSRI